MSDSLTRLGRILFYDDQDAEASRIRQVFLPNAYANSYIRFMDENHPNWKLAIQYGQSIWAELDQSGSDTHVLRRIAALDEEQVLISDDLIPAPTTLTSVDLLMPMQDRPGIWWNEKTCMATLMKVDFRKSFVETVDALNDIPYLKFLSKRLDIVAETDKVLREEATRDNIAKSDMLQMLKWNYEHISPLLRALSFTDEALVNIRNLFTGAEKQDTDDLIALAYTMTQLG